MKIISNFRDIVIQQLAVLGQDKMSAIEVENEKQQKKDNPFVLTGDEKVKIIESILKQYKIQKSTNLPLQISISYEPLKKQSKTNTNSYSNPQQVLFQYKIPGSKFKHKSKNSNLVSKLQQMEKITEDQLKQKQAIRQKQNHKEAGQSPISSSQEIEEQPETMKEQDNFRYYKDNILCYKCNKVGHYKMVCPQISNCLYCFSQQHDADNCPQKKVCYRCYDFGHVIANCKLKQSKSKCYICQKYHDEGCYFLLTKITNGQKKRGFYQPIYNDKQIRCTRCFNYGHIQCSN